MQLHAYTRTISDLFSVKKKYIVPRFQRPYSWKRTEVRELWEDIVGNISCSESEFSHSEYFIGTIVLVGDDKKSSLLIVDGQQRLTTLTILLSAICRSFIKIDERKKAEAIYNTYMVGSDDEGETYFKLENENPKPFFQNEIQHIEEMNNSSAETDEEKNLQENFSEFMNLLSNDKLKEVFQLDVMNKEMYSKALSAVREEVLNYLKVIYITVQEEEEAYTIFETLNARGMDLSSVDLIKNTLFKNLKTVHPDDDARTKWNKIVKEMNDRASSSTGNLESYVRHWWISRYSNASKDSLYKNFKRELSVQTFDAKSFLLDLYEDCKVYKIISYPYKEDFPQQEDLDIYNALIALNIFKVSQHKPLLLSLFHLKQKKLVKHKDFVNTLRVIEDFHFVFNAVCSQRASGLDQIYSKTARDLFKSESKTNSKKILSELQQQLRDKLPDKSTFISNFSDLSFLSKKESDKKLIQYIFMRIECTRYEYREFAPEKFTLEHIEPQKSKLIAKDIVGKIGNLLPLGNALNQEADDLPVPDKIVIYEKSNFALTQNFAKEFDYSWNKSKIVERSVSLADYYYNEVLFSKVIE